MKLESVPPETLMSAAVKVVEASEREKEMVADSPALREGLSLAIAMVGLTVSTVMETELLASLPSALKLPAASENVLLATEMLPAVLVSKSAVNVAV